MREPLWELRREIDDDGIGHSLLVGGDTIGVRTTTPTMQRLVRDGRSMILLVLPRAHATGRRLGYYRNRFFFESLYFNQVKRVFLTRNHGGRHSRSFVFFSQEYQYCCVPGVYIPWPPRVSS